MTRKKYVKQLMALDVTRNQANAMARICQHSGKSYEADYKARAPWLRAAQAARRLKAAFLNMGRELAKAAAVFCESFNRRAKQRGENITLEITVGGAKE